MTATKSYWLGRAGYRQVWDLQLALHSRIVSGEQPPALLLLEHDPVITIGRHGDSGNVYLAPDELSAKGVEIHHTERGGDVTYHGPGQLIGYPLLDLKALGLSVADYLRRLEDSLIALLSHYNLETKSEPGFTGVWRESDKIASIGIAVKRWVTFHGFALNVTTDLSYFKLINPCGLSKPVTSVQQMTGLSPDCRQVAREYLTAFKEVFEVESSELISGWPLLERQT